MGVRPIIYLKSEITNVKVSKCDGNVDCSIFFYRNPTDAIVEEEAGTIDEN